MTVEPQMLTAKECAALLRVSLAGVWALVNSGRFVQPIRLSPRRSRWRRDEVDAWLAEQAAEAARRRAAILGIVEPDTFRVSRGDRAKVPTRKPRG